MSADADGTTFTDISLNSMPSGNMSINPEVQNSMNQRISHTGEETEGHASSAAAASGATVSDHSSQQVHSQPEASAAEPQTEASTNNKATTTYGVFGYYMNKGVKTFYSTSEGALDKAIADIKAEVYDTEIDGENILGTWLLMEVDHWDNETEKVILLTDESIITVRYDFVPKRVYKFKRHALKEIDTIEIGEFQYPKISLLNLNSELKKRTCEGIRLKWNKGVEPGFIKNWTPTSTAMPWLTFTFHPLAFMEQGVGCNTYNVSHFTQTVTDALNTAYTKHNPDQSLIVKQTPLQQDVYWGFPSQIHNQSFLGMSKDRGFLSF